MATVNKDFKIKSGLIVEGTKGTINGYDILTKNDDQYIINLIGGTATPQNTADAVVKRDGNGDFAAGTITADLVGDVTGTVSSLSNHDTDDLSEGTSNKYFTNQRALDATASAYDVAGAAATAQGNAEDYADTVANNAYNNAVTAAANDATSKMQQAESYADQSALDAENAAKSYADGLIAQEVIDRNSAISTAINNIPENYITSTTQDFQVYNGELSVTPYTFDAYGAAATAQSNAESYTDTAVANLVDGAPQLLDTLNELAAAIADNPNYATDVANLVANKQDTLSPGNGIVIDNTTNTIYVPTYIGSGITADPTKVEIDRTVVDTWYDAAGAAATAQSNAETYAQLAANQANSDARSYVDSLAVNYDAAGSATTAENNAKAYADGLAVNYDAAGAAATAEQNAKDYADALDTDDVAEGINNLYFTDARAKSSAADLLTNATLSNITITGNGAGLTITAENGVADSTTDDLTEGETNLYFTEQRAIDAITTATISPNVVNITNYRKEEATQQYVGSASTVNVHSLSGMYESVKYLVRVVGTVSGVRHSQITEILMTIDSNNNIALTEYGTVYTSENPLATFSAAINMSLPTLTATTVVNGCEIIAAATMLSWAD